MHKQRNCKICRSDLAIVLPYMNHCEQVPYLEIIERYGHLIENLNLYNISTHFNRHVQMCDIRQVGALKAKFEAE